MLLEILCEYRARYRAKIRASSASTRSRSPGEWKIPP